MKSINPVNLPNSGVSLIEVIIALFIISVAIAGMMSAFTSNITVTENSREMSLAVNAARAMVETLQDYPTFSSTYSAYIGVTGYFNVTGLQAISGAPYNMPGQIIFPGTGGALLENVTDTNLGMPRDINGDGLIDGSNHSGDYKILPVTVQIEWQGASGQQSYQLYTILVSK